MCLNIMKHHQKPEIDKNRFDKDLKEKVQKIFQTDYYTYVNELTKYVKGQIVKDSCAGNSGFILFLDNGDWIASFLKNDKLLYENGSGKPEKRVYKMIKSEEYGNASESLNVDLPYADEECDIVSEILNSHGKKIKGLAIGEDTFNTFLGF